MVQISHTLCDSVFGITQQALLYRTEIPSAGFLSVPRPCDSTLTGKLFILKRLTANEELLEIFNFGILELLTEIDAVNEGLLFFTFTLDNIFSS